MSTAIDNFTKNLHDNLEAVEDDRCCAPMVLN